MISNLWSPGYTLEAWEKVAIVSAMAFYRNNKAATAAALGCAVRTLDAKLEKYNADDAEGNRRLRERADRDAEYIKRQRGLHGANAGVYVEPTTQISPKQSMPMQAGTEVQGVLPGPIAKSSQSRRR